MRNYISARGCLIQSSTVQLLATYSSHYTSGGGTARGSNSSCSCSFSFFLCCSCSFFLLFQIINLMCCWFGWVWGQVTRKRGSTKEVLPKTSLRSLPFNYCAAFIIKVAYDIAVDLWAWQTTWHDCVTDPVGRKGERANEGELGGTRRPGTLLWSPKMLLDAFNLKCT